MKIKNEVKNVNEQMAVKPKRMKKNRKFFLYAEGKGFIKLEEGTLTMPNFENGEPLVFETRAKAIFARDFFLSVKLADSIDVLSKVA